LDLLLICATEGEAGSIEEALAQARASAHVGKKTIQGQLGGVSCRLAFTGMGAVNAASALTYQLERQRPNLVLQFGIAGAYAPSGLNIGMVACATEEIYGDVGVLTPDGWHPADLIGIPLVSGDPPRFNRFPLDPVCVRNAAQLCGAETGPFLTLSQCTGVQSLADELYERFGAVCENMEGAAAAHVCALYDVPFLEIRGISNMVENRDRSRWNIPQAVSAVQKAVLTLAERLEELAW
jgi:futalosine hydrolase